MDDGAGGTLRKTVASRLKTYIGGSDPASADGDTLGTASLEWSDLYLADGSVIYFGNDQEIKVTHVADTGLTLKHTATADDKPITLTLQTGETDMAANDIIGAIEWQAPDEGTGTDAVLVSAAIKAYAEGDHSSSSNATTLGFYTGASEAAAIKMTLSSGGNLDVTGDVTGSTINADGDTAAGDNAAIGYTAAEGLILTGQGSTNDITIKRDDDTAVLEVATGQSDIEVTGGNILFGTGDRGVYLGVTSATAANLLNDYEEGTFTPTLTGSTTNPTKSSGTLTGYYRKIGNVVFIYIQMSWVLSDVGAGDIRIDALPFTAESSIGQSCGSMSGRGMGVADTNIVIVPTAVGNTTYIAFGLYDQNAVPAGESRMTHANLSTSSNGVNMNITLTYMEN